MRSISCRNFLEFLRIDFLLNFKNSMLLSVGYLCIIPVIRGISNLDAVRSAEVFGQSLALIGVILLIPITKKELEAGIKEIIYTKPWPYIKSAGIRLVCAFLLIAAIIIGFAIVMRLQNCRFPFWEYVSATISYASFLGLLGLVFSQVGNNSIVGYFIAFGYWAFCQFSVLEENDFAYLFPVRNGCVKTESIRMLTGTDLLLCVLFIWSSSKDGLLHIR